MLPDPRQPLPHERQRPVHGQFFDRAAALANAVALEDERGRWTYTQLASQARALSEALRTAGVREGEQVALYAHRSAGLVAGMLGILDAGAAFAVLDPAYPPKRLCAQLAPLELAAAVTVDAGGPPSAEVLRALAAARAVDPFPVRAAPTTGAGLQEQPAAHEPLRGELAYVLFTSGTTGEPKAIGTPHDPLPRFLRWHVASAGLTRKDRFALTSGLAHDPMLRDVFTPLTLGATLFIPPPELLVDPKGLRRWLAEKGITVLHLTPSMAFLLTEDRAGPPLPELRHAFFGGEPLRASIARRFRTVAPSARLVNFYGTTETPQAMGFHVVTESDLSPAEATLPLGQGVEHAQLLVLKPDLSLCAVGEEGEVHIRSPYLSAGYLNDRAQTQRRFVANPHRATEGDLLYGTGDLGAFTSGGEVEFRGRGDGQVKVRGFRVELEELEAVLARQPGVARAAVALEEPPGEEGRLVAFVQGEGGLSTSALRAAVGAELPPYMVPTQVERVASFPLTPNGKIDRRQLLSSRGPPASASVAPAVEGEDLTAKVLRLWRTVLRAEVNPDDNFFELGGYSMLAVRLLAAIEGELGQSLPMRALLVDAATPRRMAHLLAAKGGLGESHSLVALKPDGTRPPVFWMPGGGGLSVIAFRSISVRLGTDRPVWGLEAILDPSFQPRRLSDVARNYVDELVRFQPDGPYHLFGFSLGSFTAYEMGVQLSQMGKRVATLAVFDTPVPGRLSRFQRGQVFAERAVHQARRYLEMPRAEATAHAAQLARGVWSSVAARVKPPPPPLPPTWFDQVDQRNQALIRAYANAELPSFPGKVTVILGQRSSHAGVAPERDARRFWRDTAHGGIDVRCVSSNHLAMLEPPDVDGLGQVLRDVLAANET